MKGEVNMKVLRVASWSLFFVALCVLSYFAGSYVANPIARPVYAYGYKVFYAGDYRTVREYGALNGSKFVDVPLSGSTACFVLPNHFLSHATQWLVEYNEDIFIQEYRKFVGTTIEPGLEGADASKTLVSLHIGDYRGPVVFHYRDHQRGDIQISVNLVEEGRT